MRLGFSLQPTTVRYLGTFLVNPLDVPPLVTEHLARQLGIGDPSCVARYAERPNTPREHREEIKASGGLREFSGAEDEFARWVHARAWNTGDGPKTIVTDGVKWLRENAVLLPGVTTAARLVSRVRDEALEELYATLAACQVRTRRPCWRAWWWCRTVRGTPSWSCGGGCRPSRPGGAWSGR
jgi:hypothetical protein